MSDRDASVADGEGGGDVTANVSQPVQTLPPGEKKDAITEAVKTLASSEDKKAVAAAAVQAIPAGDNEARRSVASIAAQTLPPDEKKQLALETAQSLSPQKQAEVCSGLRSPTQGVTDRIWQIIVWAFAVVFVLSALAIVWRTSAGTDVQSLLTVVTTVAGILAGFISGRAASS